MSEPPSPTDVPTAVRQALANQDAATLEAVADYARALAAHRREGTNLRQSEGESTRNDPDEESGSSEPTAQEPIDGTPAEWAEDEWEAAVRDAEAPARATLTVKTINDNRYYYLQWREGDHVRSAYVGPASPTS